MNEKKWFLLSLVVGILMVLTVSAKATTADETVCAAGAAHVCYTRTADGSLDAIVTNGHGRAVVVHEECDDADTDVFFGCQPLALIRAKEHGECAGLGWPYRWVESERRGDRCVEQRPQDREDDSPPTPPPTPPTPPTPPPYTPPPPTPPGSGPGVITPPGGGSIPPPFCPATCPDCNCEVPPVGPDPCADVDGLVQELSPLEEVPANQWLVRTDTDTVRSRVYYIRERAGECAEDGLYADAEDVLAAMTPPTTVTIPPDHPITYQNEESCWDTWCPWVLGGAVATVVTGVILGVICGTGGCDPVIDVYNRPQP